MLKIKTARAIPLKSRLTTPYLWSHGVVDAFPNVLVELNTMSRAIFESATGMMFIIGVAT